MPGIKTDPTGSNKPEWNYIPNFISVLDARSGSLFLTIIWDLVGDLQKRETELNSKTNTVSEDGESCTKNIIKMYRHHWLYKLTPLALFPVHVPSPYTVRMQLRACAQSLLLVLASCQMGPSLALSPANTHNMFFVSLSSRALDLTLKYLGFSTSSFNH